jgi:hypothetical protein
MTTVDGKMTATDWVAFRLVEHFGDRFEMRLTDEVVEVKDPKTQQIIGCALVREREWVRHRAYGHPWLWSGEEYKGPGWAKILADDFAAALKVLA